MADYRIIIGGFTVLDPDGQHMMSASGVEYTMTLKHILGMERFLSQPDMQKLFNDFSAEAASSLTDLGAAFGLAKGRVTDEDIDEVMSIQGNYDKVKGKGRDRER